MSASANTERRAFAAEVRASGRRLEGYVATFGAEARIGTFTETIRAGAFRDTLAAGGDKLALVDHDPGRVLARTRSGTLRLAEDTRGLAFDLDVPETQAGRDVLALASRGDVGGMSFGFSTRDEAWDGTKRELRAVELYEISVVLAWPAYGQTEINVRSAGAQGSLRSRLARLHLHAMRP